MTYAPARPPLRFVVPPRWPEPSPTWVARNQGWQPPAGWVPPVVDGWPRVAPAPAGWGYWAPEPGVWQAFREPFRKAATGQIVRGSLFLGIGGVISIIGYITLGNASLLLWATLIYGAIRLVMGIANLQKVDDNARDAVIVRSLAIRSSMDSAAYPQYLAETAAHRAAMGYPAMTMEQLSTTLDAEPWGTPNPWNAPLGNPWGPPALAARSEFSVRKRFWIPLAVLGALLLTTVGVGIASGLAHTDTAGSGSAPAASTGRHWPVTAGTYGVKDVSYAIVESGSCSTAAGCIQVDVIPPRSCAAATITWGFSDSRQSDDKARRTTPVSFTAGQTTHVSIPEDAQLEPLKYLFLDGIDCG